MSTHLSLFSVMSPYIFCCIYGLGCSDNTPTAELNPQVREPEVAGNTAGDNMSSGTQNVGDSMSAGTLTGGTSLGGMTAGDSMNVGGMSISAGDELASGCQEELCDALDNDCDGQVDENLLCECTADPSCYSGPPMTRSVGVCQDGARSCDSSGEHWLDCLDSVTPIAEVCDTLDNDCDGQVDEGITCGECEASGLEECDGIDNDCDGYVDEELVRACPCAKVAGQMQICQQGVWEGCEDEIGRRLASDVTTIILPELTPDCPFDTADNLEEDGGVFAARVEQTHDFNLPDGAQLCGFSLTGSNEDFYFDDELMLLINEVPLIGSVNFASQLEILDGLPRYDWLRIRGKSSDEVGDVATCLAGATECLIPGTQRNGELRVAFDLDTNTRLASTNDQGRYQFKIVVVGDNDPDLDCAHSGLTLQISYDYLVP